MHHTGGPGWRITVDTSAPLLLGLYIRDVAGLAGAGTPALAPMSPPVRAADHSHLTAEVGGLSAVRYEWELWWRRLLQASPAAVPVLSPPDFPEITGLPALQRVVGAHYGAALDWQHRHQAAYARAVERRETLGGHKILAELVQNRELELGRSARDFTLVIVELPLAEPRAWLLEPNRVLMSERLLEDPVTFQSYVEPVINLLV